MEKEKTKQLLEELKEFLKQFLPVFAAEKAAHVGEGNNTLHLHEIIKILRENKPEDKRAEFVEAIIELSPRDRTAINEIYNWWWKERRKMENSFVSLIMKIGGEKRKKVLEYLADEWNAGRRDSVEFMLYQLEHDWLDQGLKYYLVEPILIQLHEFLSSKLEIVRRRANEKLKIKGEK